MKRTLTLSVLLLLFAGGCVSLVDTLSVESEETKATFIKCVNNEKTSKDFPYHKTFSSQYYGDHREEGATYFFKIWDNFGPSSIYHHDHAQGTIEAKRIRLKFNFENNNIDINNIDINNIDNLQLSHTKNTVHKNESRYFLDGEKLWGTYFRSWCEFKLINYPNYLYSDCTRLSLESYSHDFRIDRHTLIATNTLKYEIGLKGFSYHKYKFYCSGSDSIEFEKAFDKYFPILEERKKQRIEKAKEEKRKKEEKEKRAKI